MYLSPKSCQVCFVVSKTESIYLHGSIERFQSSQMYSGSSEVLPSFTLYDFPVLVILIFNEVSSNSSTNSGNTYFAKDNLCVQWLTNQRGLLCRYDIWY